MKCVLRVIGRRLKYKLLTLALDAVTFQVGIVFGWLGRNVPFSLNEYLIQFSFVLTIE
jgi:hypothetical protein